MVKNEKTALPPLLTRRNRWKRLVGYKFWVGWLIRVLIPVARKILDFIWHIVESIWTMTTIFAVTTVLILFETWVRRMRELALAMIEICEYLRLYELYVKMAKMGAFWVVTNWVGTYAGFKINEPTFEYSDSGGQTALVIVVMVGWKVTIETWSFFKQWLWNIAQDPLLDQEPASWTEAVNVLVWVVLAGIPGL